MDAPANAPETQTDTDPETPVGKITSHETRPGRLVFTERDNVDGWIATDAAVDLEP